MRTVALLNLRYDRATTDEQRARIQRQIDAILAENPCPTCDEPTRDGVCQNPNCPAGRENLYWEAAERRYSLRHDL